MNIVYRICKRVSKNAIAIKLQVLNFANNTKQAYNYKNISFLGVFLFLKL